MYNSRADGFFKHWDFAIIDVLVMYLSYIFTYLMLRHSFAFASARLGRYVMLAYLAANLLVTFASDSYRNIRRRNNSSELWNCLIHTGFITLLVIASLFAVQQGERQSRLQIGFTFITYLVFTFAARTVYKRKLKKRPIGKNAPSVLIVTVAERAEATVRRMLASEQTYQLRITGVCVIDSNMAGQQIAGVPVIANKDDLLGYICHQWVDEVFFELGHGYVTPDIELLDNLMQMGITTHVKIYRRDKSSNEWERSVENYGPYMVLTRSAKIISMRQRIAKRTLDICGGIVGTLFTGILFVFLAPAIYIQSPGPIFFAQERIGMNGRRFKMYKFRSMVMNADELKAKYMAQNRVSDGMMFKLDWDPRIIGNKELPDGTRKTGIGEFIRKTSLDEFPQFLNVLKGEMSLVGTRPPTVDEWEKYELVHRGRMAVKPGITGMWQVSGRSDITDFDEVVRLDRLYISNWNFALDIKIILRTFGAVLSHKGSM